MPCELLLSEAGFEVRSPSSIAAAKRVFRERPADILVTDVGLPDGSGLELLGSLTAVPPDLRAIVLSGYGMEEDVARSRSLGFAEHFVKPLNLSRLIAALDALGDGEPAPAGMSGPGRGHRGRYFWSTGASSAARVEATLPPCTKPRRNASEKATSPRRRCSADMTSA